MDQKQIEIGDKLFKILKDKKGVSPNEQYTRLLEMEGYNNREEILPTLNRLKDKNLVRPSKDGFSLILTDEGFDAAKDGLATYLNNKNYAAELDIRTKETAITTARWSLGISIVAILVATLAFLNEANLLPLNLSEETEGKGPNSNNNSKKRDNNTQYIESNLLVVPEQVTELKKALTHDSVFIKELAKEIKRAQ